MNLLTIPYIAGGLSHLLPLYVLQQRYLKNSPKFKNQFLVTNSTQNFLMMHGIRCVPIDYVFDDNLMLTKEFSKINECVVDLERQAYEIVQPSVIIEDTASTTPLIAEKNHIPRISIQRTGMFRSIDKRYRNANHVHSLQKGTGSQPANLSTANGPDGSFYDDVDSYYLQLYSKPKAKIIPGIATIERLPDNIENRESYFYSGPLIVIDKPSAALSARLDEFLNTNKQKPIVFITTGTIDRTPIEDFIEFFVKRNYAVITTCNCAINEAYPDEIFYNKLLPLNYICGISNLVIHQCGSGMYHYPIMNRVPSLTIGTQCYDREDIALRLQQLGVSAHIPHPDDDPAYWNIFLEHVERFEKNTLVDYEMIDRLRMEIDQTMADFNMEKVIQFALT